MIRDIREMRKQKSHEKRCALMREWRTEILDKAYALLLGDGSWERDRSLVLVLLDCADPVLSPLPGSLMASRGPVLLVEPRAKVAELYGIWIQCRVIKLMVDRDREHPQTIAAARESEMRAQKWIAEAGGEDIALMVMGSGGVSAFMLDEDEGTITGDVACDHADYDPAMAPRLVPSSQA